MRRTILLGAVGLILALAMHLVMASPTMRRIEERVGDRRLRMWRQLSEADTSAIVIVAVDGASLEALGLRWPMPRGVYARLIDLLRKSGAGVIGVTVVFEGPGAYPLEDAALTRAVLTKQDVVLASRLDRRQQPPQVVRPFIPKAPSGFTDVTVDKDGVCRDLYLWPEGFAEPPPSMALELLRVLYHDESFTPRGFAGPPGTRYPIAFAGRPGDAFTTIPLRRVLAGANLGRELENKIVLVGSTMPRLSNALPTPFDKETPGVEIMANVVHTLLAGHALHRLSGAEQGVLMFFMVFISFQVMARINPLLGFVLTFVTLALYLLGATYAMVMSQRVLPLVGPVLGVAAAYCGAVTYSIARGVTGLATRGRRQAG